MFNTMFTIMQKGLESLGPYLKDIISGGSLFCSKISSSFVLSQFDEIRASNVTELINNKPVVICVKDERDEDYKLRVTAIDANHCPGSIMILFEKMDSEENVISRILYTGDFRFDDGMSLERMAALHSEDKRTLKIDELYLDTTFMEESYQIFPGRKQSEQQIWDLVNNWVGQNRIKQRGRKKEYVVMLHPPARYGYENILNNIYLRSGLELRVHVPAIKYHTYLCHTSLTDCTDEDPSIARYVHACSHKSPIIEHCKNVLPCRENNKNLSVLHIKPSAMWFTNDKLVEGPSRQVFGAGDTSRSDCQKYRVCYSTHASLSEIQTFIKYLKPEKIVPCVLPSDDEKRRAMMDLVNDIMKTYAVMDSKNDLENGTSDVEEFGDSFEITSCEGMKSPLKRRITGEAWDIQKAGNVTPKRIRSDESLHFEGTSKKKKDNISTEHGENETLRREGSTDSLHLVLEESPEKKEEDAKLDDTPDIEDIIADAESENMPDYVMKSLREEEKRRQRLEEDIILID